MDYDNNNINNNNNHYNDNNNHQHTNNNNNNDSNSITIKRNHLLDIHRTWLATGHVNIQLQIIQECLIEYMNYIQCHQINMDNFIKYMEQWYIKKTGKTSHISFNNIHINPHTQLQHTPLITPKTLTISSTTPHLSQTQPTSFNTQSFNPQQPFTQSHSHLSLTQPPTQQQTFSPTQPQFIIKQTKNGDLVLTLPPAKKRKLDNLQQVCFLFYETPLMCIN